MKEKTIKERLKDAMEMLENAGVGLENLTVRGTQNCAVVAGISSYVQKAHGILLEAISEENASEEKAGEESDEKA